MQKCICKLPEHFPNCELQTANLNPEVELCFERIYLDNILSMRRSYKSNKTLEFCNVIAWLYKESTSILLAIQYIWPASCMAHSNKNLTMRIIKQKSIIWKMDGPVLEE